MSNKGIIGNLDETEKRCEWEIPNFFSLCQTDCFCESPSFPFANASFHLRIYPLCNPYDFLSLYLKCDSEPSPDVTYSFSIRKNDGTLIGTATKPYVFNQCNGFAKFFKGRYLRTQALELLPADTLTIICELKSDFPEKQTLSNVNEANNLKENTVVEASEQIRLTDLDTLSENLKNLFLNKDSCDTTLHVMGKEYKAHKTVLMARSSVFAAMFMHETSEKQTGIVNIPDSDPESFEEFLEFLYSGKLEKPSHRSALHLYQTSEKYDVQNLKIFCAESLMENLTVEYLCDVVILAEKYNDTKLFSEAQCFFNNNLRNVFATSEWKDLLINNHCLANKLLMEMSSKVKVLE